MGLDCAHCQETDVFPIDRCCVEVFLLNSVIFMHVALGDTDSEDRGPHVLINGFFISGKICLELALCLGDDPRGYQNISLELAAA